MKILHYDLNGYVIYQKWFDDGKMLKPKFMVIKSCHLITREQVTLLVSNTIQSKMYIYDDKTDDPDFVASWQKVEEALECLRKHPTPI